MYRVGPARDDGQMMDDVARYYQDLLADSVWCAEGLRATVDQ
jgi:hypothetical protein